MDSSIRVTPAGRWQEIASRPEEDLDLPEAALVIAAEEYRGLDIPAYLKRIDDMAAVLKRRLPRDISIAETIVALNGYLFDELGFAGNAADYYDPRNSFLNEVIDRRSGIPITLSLVYLEVGRRCGLRVDGVSFPGHFLCKVSLDEGELIVDAFNRGQLLGLAELERRFASAAGDAARFDARLLRAARPKEILARMLQNLRSIYLDRGDLPRALSAVDRQLLLQPDEVRVLRDRARLCEQLGGAEAAAADLETVLRLDPASSDAAALRARVDRLRGSGKLMN